MPLAVTTAGRPIDIAIGDTQSHLRVDARAFAALAARVLEREGVEHAVVSISLVDDAAIHEINRRHLGHDWPTDVITFRLSDPGDPRLEADLILSAEMAAATAREIGVDPLAELSLYLVHGLLHLCGYDDIDPEQARAMRRREDEVLAREGILNTYAMVASQGGDTGARGGPLAHREGRP